MKKLHFIVLRINLKYLQENIKIFPKNVIHFSFINFISIKSSDIHLKKHYPVIFFKSNYNNNNKPIHFLEKFTLSKVLFRFYAFIIIYIFEEFTFKTAED